MPQKANKRVYELKLVYKIRQGRVELLKNVLISTGVKLHEIIEYDSGLEHKLSVYFRDYNKARSLKVRLKKLNLSHVAIEIVSLKKKDWESKWQDNYKPFNVTNGFMVAPSRFKGKLSPRKRQLIFIDTSFAFGTGLHATTRFMVGFLEKVKGSYDSVLDVGTGTGILAIVAHKCEAKNVQAIDLKRDVIKVTKENLELNDCKAVKARAVNFTNYKRSEKFDYVAANLITFDLIDMGRKLVSLVKKDKYLAVSGISINNYPLFKKAFANFPLRCLKIEKGEGWVAVLYKKVR